MREWPIWFFLFFFKQKCNSYNIFNNDVDVSDLLSSGQQSAQFNFQAIKNTQTQTGLDANIFYTPHDTKLIHNFLLELKRLNGEWSKVGIQRVIRLNAACTRNYVTLRKTVVKADIPLDEAFKDPYSALICFFAMKILRNFRLTSSFIFF